MYKIAAAGEVNVFSPASLAGYVATAIVTIIGFLITVFILKKLLYKPLMNTIDKRQKQVNDKFDEVDRKTAEIREREVKMDTAAEDRLKQAADQAAALQERSKETAAAIVAEARAEAEAIRSKAEAEQKQRQEADEDRLYHKAVDLAMVAVANFLSGAGGDKPISEYDDVRLILSNLVKAEQEELKEGGSVTYHEEC